MNKKHLWGILIVLAISIFVLYTDLKSTPINQLVRAARNINWLFFALIFVLMLLSYVFEASIIYCLAKRKMSPKEANGLFLEFRLFKLFLMPLHQCQLVDNLRS